MPCDRCPSTAVFSAMRVRFCRFRNGAARLSPGLVCRGGGRHGLAALIQRDRSVPAQKDLQPDFDACHALAKILLVPGQGVHLASWPRVYIQRSNPLPDQTRERSADSENAYKLQTHSPVGPLILRAGRTVPTNVSASILRRTTGRFGRVGISLPWPYAYFLQNVDPADRGMRIGPGSQDRRCHTPVGEGRCLRRGPGVAGGQTSQDSRGYARILTK